jgi:hypothetical protein
MDEVCGVVYSQIGNPHLFRNQAMCQAHTFTLTEHSTYTALPELEKHSFIPKGSY